MESSLVVKVFAILEALAGEREGQSLAHLAEQVELPKPTLHRILKIMVGLGYVDRPEDSTYRLTDRFTRLGPGGDERLAAVAHPILADLHEQTGETINLGVLRRDRVTYLEVIESRHALRRIAEPNSTDPFYCTALGRAIVANLDADRRDYLLRQRSAFLKRTRHTVTDNAQLRRILDRARRDGYALERDQTDVGVTCVAAPVWQDGNVVAAISISTPTARAVAGGNRERDLIRAVREAADTLTQQLEHQLEEAVTV